MAILLTGLQGSGKSYFAMHKMYNERDKFYRIYTNIDGLRATDKIHALDFNGFINDIIMPSYDLIVNQDKSFEDCISYLKSVDFLPENVSKENRIMIVVDEAQNHFSKKNAQLSWLITQHRHLFMELILITQKYTLLHSDYYLFNLVYDAVPPVKQFNKKVIAYNEYAGLPINNDNFVRKFALKKNQVIFDLYVSGDKVESPNILKRFIFMGLGALLFVGLTVYYLMNTLGEHDEITPIDNKVNITEKVNIKKYSNADSSSDSPTYLKLDCFSNICKNKKNKIEISLDDFEGLLKETDSKYLHSEKLSSNRAFIFLLASPDFMGLFTNRSEKNEKGFVFNN